MPQPVKLSDALVEAARAEVGQGGALDRRARSSTGQRWAAWSNPASRPPRSTHSRSGQSSLEQVLPPAEEGAAILTALRSAMDANAAAGVRNSFKGKVRYGADPAHPGFFVRVEPDGRRTVGRLVDGKFEALTQAVADHA